MIPTLILLASLAVMAVTAPLVLREMESAHDDFLAAADRAGGKP